MWRTDLDQRIERLVALRDNLANCIGCGCLSLTSCPYTSPGDAMGEQGPGAHRLMGVVEASFTTATTSYSLTGALLGNVASTNFTANVSAFPTGVATWRSTGPTTPVRSRTLGAGMACGSL